MEVLYQVLGDPEPDARIETVIRQFWSWMALSFSHRIFTKACGCKTQEEAAHLHNKFAQIIALYDLTPVWWMRHNKSIRCHGIVSSYY
jgi:hypothetical protein